MTRGAGKPHIRVRGATAFAATAALCATLAGQRVIAAPGDLDPAFANAGLYVETGRYAGLFRGLSITVQDPARYLVSLSCSPPRVLDGFRARLILPLDDRGLLDPGFQASMTWCTYAQRVVDVAAQSDGKIVAVGSLPGPTVLRLDANGTPDATFGTSGYVSGLEFSPTSVVLEPDGRIVVAGSSGGDLVVERFMADGTPDISFADAGTFHAAAVGQDRQTIVRAGDGYAVLAQDAPDSVARCRVLALTSDGVAQQAYGDNGYASLGTTSGVPVTCRSLAALPDGRVLVVGTSGGHGFAVRLSATGGVDGGFDAASVTLMSDARAVAVALDGSSVVAGPSAGGESGVRVLRLRADGTLDDGFGDAGASWIDLAYASVNDLALLSDRTVLLVGGSGRYWTGTWVARLLGDAGGDNPGRVGFKWPSVPVAQDSPHAELTVRRTGGRSGATSVGFRAHALGTPLLTASASATEGADFVAVTGRLDWADGDAGDRTVLIPMAPDTAAPEEPEAFEVELYDATGAVIGTGRGTVEIAGDEVPAGFLAIGASGFEVGESQDSVQIPIIRKYHTSGSVSVTLTPSAATAVPGVDYDATPVTVSWADGESDAKYANVRIFNDAVIEASETFAIELSNATGGAAIGSQSTATVTIYDDEPAASAPPPNSGGSSSGGGGSLDWLVYALIAAGATRRAVFRARR